MKKRALLLGYWLLYPLVSVGADPSCPLPATPPCGVEEVISCARVNYIKLVPGSTIATNEQFYNQQLFDSNNQDGFCKATLPHPGVIDTNLTGTYYKQFCVYQQGTYFSYANFISAATTLNNSSFGGPGGFACSQNGSLSVAQNTALSVQEAVNFFASEAQETTSAMKGHTTDGLYFRYENASLKDQAGAECTSLDCKTGYYPPNNPANWVGVDSVDLTAINTKTLTPFLWLLTSQSPSSSSYYIQYGLDPVTGLMSVLTPTPSVSLTGTVPYSAGTQLYIATHTLSPVPTLVNVLNINDARVLDAGMYVGMGSLQLTGSTMYFYYSWYQKYVENNPLMANFATFIGDPRLITNSITDHGFLRDGTKAFQGAFWYWMKRSIGRDFPTTGLMFPTLHRLAMDPSKPACHCVGAVTLMVNGGCNHFEFRAMYATYFAGARVLNLQNPESCLQTIKVPGSKDVTINGAMCTLTGPDTLDAATQNLKDYCLTPTT